MAAFFNALFAAGPLAGWFAVAMLFTFIGWAVLRDWVILKGRHLEQREHYEQVLTQTHLTHQTQVDILRAHMQELNNQLVKRAERAEATEQYWMTTAMELMSISAAAVGRSDGQGA